MKDGPDKKEWFKGVFDDNYDYVRNYLYYLSGDIALSEDLVQDVFLQLWEKLDEVRIETVRSLLFIIARNSFLKARRRQKYDLKFRSTYFENVENKSPEYLMELEEFDKKLQAVISKMPEKCRLVFLLNRIDDMTYREIAKSLGITVKAVEKNMSRALSIIKKELGTGAGLI
jgi:RNA polymerase sigma-70 factor (family 1)